MRIYRPESPAVVYVPLVDYQEAGEEPYYIRKWILRGLRYSGQAGSMDEALHGAGPPAGIRGERKAAVSCCFWTGSTRRGENGVLCSRRWRNWGINRAWESWLRTAPIR